LQADFVVPGMNVPKIDRANTGVQSKKLEAVPKLQFLEQPP
jgi:hypothetical protein